MATTTITTDQLEQLQKGLKSNVAGLLAMYAECTDDQQCAALQDKCNQLAAQNNQLETAIFHQQTIEAENDLQETFTSAQGLTAQLTELTAKMDKVADAIAAAGKVVGLVAQVVAKL